MPGRRIWVVLLLAAVFSMHGLQCMAAPEAGHASMGAAAGTSGTTAMGAAPGAETLVGHLVAAGRAAGAAALPTGNDLPGSAAAGLWVVCLAVLFTGLGLVGAALMLLLRSGLGPRSPTPHPQPVWRTGWARPPRPPDLFSLCLLRT